MAFIIILTIVGLVLLFSEVFLIPGVGVAGVAGALTLAGASYYMFYEFGMLAGGIYTALLLALIIGLIIYAIKTNAWKKLALNTRIDSNVRGSEEDALSVGDTGKTVTRLAPIGTARINGKSYEVKALEGMIAAGADVEVVLLEDNKIYVQPVSEDF